MENPIHSFREPKLVLQLITESHIKSKTVMSWSLRKKEKGIFCAVYFVRREFFSKICVLSQCIVSWTHFQNIHTFTYQKTLIHTLSLLVLQLPKTFSVSISVFGYEYLKKEMLTQYFLNSKSKHLISILPLYQVWMTQWGKA